MRTIRNGDVLEISACVKQAPVLFDATIHRLPRFIVRLEPEIPGVVTVGPAYPITRTKMLMTRSFRARKITSLEKCLQPLDPCGTPGSIYAQGCAIRCSRPPNLTLKELRARDGTRRRRGAGCRCRGWTRGGNRGQGWIDERLDDVLHVAPCEPSRLLVRVLTEPRVDVHEEVVGGGREVADEGPRGVRGTDGNARIVDGAVGGGGELLEMGLVVVYSRDQPGGCVRDGVTSGLGIEKVFIADGHSENP